MNSRLDYFRIIIIDRYLEYHQVKFMIPVKDNSGSVTLLCLIYYILLELRAKKNQTLGNLLYVPLEILNIHSNSNYVWKLKSLVSDK